MEVSRTSAVERALSIPELLDIIFGMSDRLSNAQNAQVCKRWSATALDVLWKEVSDICWLFSLLAPLRRDTETGCMEFQMIPDVDCWKKFERYSFRVRQLRYVRCVEGLSRSAFDIVARTRLRLDVLPNLHTLVWDAPADLAVIFMHSAVKTFEISLPNKLDSVSPFLRDVTVRMPDISNLNIRFHWPVNEAELIYLITRLSKLRTITLPQYYVTPKIMEALSQLPNLGAIKFNNRSFRDEDDVIRFTPRIDEGAFPNLYELSLSATFDEFSQFLYHKFSPKRLTYLYVASDIMETGKSAYDFLSVVAETCPLLQDLYLTYSCSDEEPSEIAPFKITADQLKPVFKLSDLKSLEIAHYYPLSLKMEDIDLFATSCRSLESLVLNNEPAGQLQQSELTLEALLPFANHCPDLIHLGLFVDASYSKIASPQLIPPLTSFKRLKLLSMGISIIDDDQSAALYLSHILPLGCQVEELDPEAWCYNDDLYEVASDRNARWMAVDELLPELIQLRVEEKKK